MTAQEQVPTPSPIGPLARYEKNLRDRITDFNDPRQEWRRLFSEVLGTFFLVPAAAGPEFTVAKLEEIETASAAITVQGDPCPEAMQRPIDR
jgi:aquaporin Z